KALEALVLGGALDSFESMHRAQYFVEDNNQSFISKALKFGKNYQESLNSNQTSLFGEGSKVETPKPIIPDAERWSSIHELKREKEVIGIYISGHPLDDYKIDIRSFCNGDTTFINNVESYRNREFTLAAIITDSENRYTRKGDPYGMITIEDYEDTARIPFFGTDYGKFKEFMINGAFVFIKGKIMPKKWKQDEFQFKVLNMELLSELRSKKASGLEIFLPIELINMNIIDEIDNLFKQNEGRFLVKFNITDIANNITVEMPSRSRKVDISDNLLKSLDKQGIEYKLV
ncbi:MAG TPA: hypothetical protein VFQ86_12240, partial [Arachidicoccus soli]|nr:hypothetical protein [Arachidicoccus soli]